MRRLLRLLSASAALALAGCLSDPVSVPEVDPATTTFANSLNISIASMTRTASGLYFRDDSAGTGTATAAAGDSVTVHYTGWLSNGVRFDTSREGTRGPIGFRLGARPPRVIAGWEEGLLGMKVRGRRTLVIPPSLAYGPNDFNGIPGNSILVFEVQLVSLVPAGTP